MTSATFTLKSTLLACATLLALNACSGGNSSSEPASAPLGQCQKDTDCKGDRICDKGMCTAPNAASAIPGASGSLNGAPASAALGSIATDTAASAQELQPPAAYAGKWKEFDGKGKFQGEVNIPAPDNKALIAQLRQKCGTLEFSFDVVSGKEVLEDIKAIKESNELLIQEMSNQDYTAAERKKFSDEYRSNIQNSTAWLKRFEPNGRYMSHIYNCVDGATRYYFPSPNEGVKLDRYGGDGNFVTSLKR